MPFSPETIAVKPYNQCINCDNLGVKCDGPNVIAMSKMRFCEWCRDRKDYLGWSNSKLAEVSCISKTTIDRIMTGKVAGLNGETISAVTCALIYGYANPEETWGKYPCPMGANVPGEDKECSECKRLLDELNQSEKEVERLRKQNKDQTGSDREKIDFLKSQIAFKENQMTEKDKLLTERAEFMRQKDEMISDRDSEIKKKNKDIRRRNWIIFVLSAVIVFAFIVDLIDRTAGFFFLDRLANGLR